MYSVLRFTIERERVGELLAIGQAMNVVERGIYEGPRRAGDGFACDVARSERWSDHVGEVRELVRTHGPSIHEAVARGARVTFDVAIDADDQAAARMALVLGLPPAVLAELGAAGVGVELTLYQTDRQT